MRVHRPPFFVAHPSVLLAVALLATAVGLTAQERSALPGSAVVWPASPPSPGTSQPADDARFYTDPILPTGGLNQERPLPVYDDAGNVIRLSEIEAEVDTSGLKGGFWGALLGVTLGSGLGTLMAPTDCGGVRGGYRYYCSPREEALNSALPGSFALFFGAVGAWIGWEADLVTFDEALEKIRRRRRVGTR